MDDYELNRRELTGDDALRFAREAGMEEASRCSLFYAGVGDLIRFARLVRAGWTPPAAAPFVDHALDTTPVASHEPANQGDNAHYVRWEEPCK